MRKFISPRNVLSVIGLLAAASTAVMADNLPAEMSQPSACKGTYTLVSHSDGRFTGKGVVVLSGGNPSTILLSTRSAAYSLRVPEMLQDYTNSLANQCAVVKGTYSEVNGQPHVTVETIEAKPN